MENRSHCRPNRLALVSVTRDGLFFRVTKPFWVGARQSRASEWDFQRGPATASGAEHLYGTAQHGEFPHEQAIRTARKGLISGLFSVWYTFAPEIQLPGGVTAPSGRRAARPRGVPRLPPARG